jgi:hypothetical protein
VHLSLSHFLFVSRSNHAWASRDAVCVPWDVAPARRLPLTSSDPPTQPTRVGFQSCSPTPAHRRPPPWALPCCTPSFPALTWETGWGCTQCWGKHLCEREAQVSLIILLLSLCVPLSVLIPNALLFHRARGLVWCFAFTCDPMGGGLVCLACVLFCPHLPLFATSHPLCRFFLAAMKLIEEYWLQNNV